MLPAPDEYVFQPPDDCSRSFGCQRQAPSRDAVKVRPVAPLRRADDVYGFLDRQSIRRGGAVGVLDRLPLLAVALRRHVGVAVGDLLADEQGEVAFEAEDVATADQRVAPDRAGAVLAVVGEVLVD